jgi:hypothetical protein
MQGQFSFLLLSLCTSALPDDDGCGQPKRVAVLNKPNIQDLCSCSIKIQIDAVFDSFYFLSS